jgi:hypothetical protein
MLASPAGKAISKEEGDNPLMPSSTFCSGVITFRLTSVVITS